MASSLQASPSRPHFWSWLEPLLKPGPSGPPPNSSTTSVRTGGAWPSALSSPLLTEHDRVVLLQLTPSNSPAALQPVSPPLRKERDPGSSILQDLGIVEEVLADVAGFAAGKPIGTTIDGYGISVVVLTGGPVAPYQTISGGIFQIIMAVLGLAGEFAAGVPIQLAVKENVTWYGVTLTPKAPA